VTPEELKKRLEALGPETQVEVRDLTGTQDHYEALVVSASFEGKMTIERHRMVYGLLQDEMDSGEVHALSLRTLTGKQYEDEKGGVQ